MTWQLVEEKDAKYFCLKGHNVMAIQTTNYGADQVLDRFTPHFLKQIHSDIIIDLDADDCRTGDGLRTDKKDFCLGVEVADCLPVYIFTSKTICLIHCGWRSIIKGIAKRAALMFDDYEYILGASINPCCYDVHEDVAELFKAKYQNAVISRSKKYWLDLKAAVSEDLGTERLAGSLNFCTKCSPEYFCSYRRGDGKKRNYALLSMVRNHGHAA